MPLSPVLLAHLSLSEIAKSLRLWKLYLIRNVLSSISECLAFFLAGVASVLKTRAALQLENVALRHQIGVLQRSAKKRPRLRAADRLLWVWLSRVWTVPLENCIWAEIRD